MSRYHESDKLPGNMCAGCRFWKLDEINEARPDWEELELRLDTGSCDVGECRRNAPIQVQLSHFPESMARSERDSIFKHGIWPETFADSWCGQFEKGLSNYAIPSDEPTKEQGA